MVNDNVRLANLEWVIVIESPFSLAYGPDSGAGVIIVVAYLEYLIDH